MRRKQVLQTFVCRSVIMFSIIIYLQQKKKKKKKKKKHEKT